MEKGVKPDWKCYGAETRVAVRTREIPFFFVIVMGAATYCIGKTTYSACVPPILSQAYVIFIGISLEAGAAMRFFLSSALSLAVSAAPTFAADLMAPNSIETPQAQVALTHDWSGFYIGGNGGWGQSHDHRSIEPQAPFPGIFLGDYDADGGTIGGQIGYRWQANGLVFGLEAQGNWGDFSGYTPNYAVPGGSLRSKTKAFGLFTAQVGYAWNDVLLYAKGGASVTRRNYQFMAPGGALASSTGDETRFGGTAGAGIEFPLNRNWSLGIEYDRIFEGRHNVSFTIPRGSNVSGFKTGGDTDLVLGRLNYKF